jgi:hypothetical protein
VINAFTNEMIFELVAKIDEPDDVIKRYGLETKDLQKLKKDPQFQLAYKEASKFWHGASNARERITQKSLAMLEDGLLALHGIASNAGLNPGQRLDALAQIAKLAKMDGGERVLISEGGAAGISGPSVQVTINLANAGGEKIEKVITDMPQPVTLEHEDE